MKPAQAAAPRPFRFPAITRTTIAPGGVDLRVVLHVAGQQLRRRRQRGGQFLDVLGEAVHVEPCGLAGPELHGAELRRVLQVGGGHAGLEGEPGHVVNTSSGNGGIAPLPTTAVNATSKAAVSAFTVSRPRLGGQSMKT